MQIAVDFSIWCPTSVWGHASGTLWVPRKPSRDHTGVPDVPPDLIECPTEVQFISEHDGMTYVAMIVYAKNAEAGTLLGTWCERELGLDIWPYDGKSPAP
jgi:hypothetical protein